MAAEITPPVYAPIVICPENDAEVDYLLPFAVEQNTEDPAASLPPLASSDALASGHDHSVTWNDSSVNGCHNDTGNEPVNEYQHGNGYDHAMAYDHNEDDDLASYCTQDSVHISKSGQFDIGDTTNHETPISSSCVLPSEVLMTDLESRVTSLHSAASDRNNGPSSSTSDVYVNASELSATSVPSTLENNNPAAFDSDTDVDIESDKESDWAPSEGNISDDSSCSTNSTEPIHMLPDEISSIGTHTKPETEKYSFDETLISNKRAGYLDKIVSRVVSAKELEGVGARLFSDNALSKERRVVQHIGMPVPERGKRADPATNHFIFRNQSKQSRVLPSKMKDLNCRIQSKQTLVRVHHKSSIVCCPICVNDWGIWSNKMALNAHIRFMHSVNTDVQCLLCSSRQCGNHSYSFESLHHVHHNDENGRTTFICPISKVPLRDQNHFLRNLSKDILPVVKIKRLKLTSEQQLTIRRLYLYDEKTYAKHPRFGAPLVLDNSESSSTENACPLCMVEHDTAELLQLHWDKHMGEIHKFHVCSLCDDMVRKSHFEKHMRGHGLKNAQLCGVCLKIVRFPMSLERHALIHSSAFECENCGLGFQKQENYLAHVKTHVVADTPYKCLVEHCGAVFNTRHGLVHHIIMHRKGDATHSCLVCGYEALSGKDFKSHMRLHSDIRMHHCSMCSQVFLNRFDYDQHRSSSECSGFEDDSSTMDVTEAVIPRTDVNHSSSLKDHTKASKVLHTKNECPPQNERKSKASAAEKQLFECIICKAQFTTEKALLNHIGWSDCFKAKLPTSSEQPPHPKELQTGTGKSMQTCANCGAQFKFLHKCS